jgi:hypothetical protein
MTYGKFSSLSGTLSPIPQYSNFVLELKVWNAFSEVFPNTNLAKFRKTRSEVRIQDKKVILRRKSVGGGKRTWAKPMFTIKRHAEVLL